MMNDNSPLDLNIVKSEDFQENSFEGLQSEPLIYILPKNENVSDFFYFETNNPLNSCKNLISDIEIKSEEEFEVSDAGSLEQEPLVYEITKKRRKRKSNEVGVELLCDPLKVEIEENFNQQVVSEETVKTDSCSGTFNSIDWQDCKPECKSEVLQACMPKSEENPYTGDINVDDFIYEQNTDIEEANIKSHICNVCKGIFKNKKYLKHHKRRQHNVYSKGYDFTCDLCCEKFKGKGSLRKHISKRHIGQEKGHIDGQFGQGELVCSVCTLVFSNVNKLRFHMRRKHNIDESSFSHVCTVCSLSYDKVDSLYKHMKRKHLSAKPIEKDDRRKIFECKICTMIYLSSASLNRHVHSAHETRADAANHACHVCAERFASKVILRSHVAKSHSKDNYVCSICGSQFKLKDSFRRHVDRKHQAPSGDKFLCSHCGDTFDSEVRLSKHINKAHSEFSQTNKNISPTLRTCNISVETRDSTFDCKRCCFKGQHWKELGRHIKHVHLLNRPRKCVERTPCHFCGMAIKRDGLTKHIQRQHGSNHLNGVIKCSICEFQCTQRSDLRTHLKKHSPESGISDICDCKSQVSAPRKKCLFHSTVVRAMEDHCKRDEKTFHKNVRFLNRT